MSDTGNIAPPVKPQYLNDNPMLDSNMNKSPSKQAFSTIKNFLKSKSSLTDLRVRQDNKKEELKEKQTNFFIDNDNTRLVFESKSSSKLPEFKIRVPRKKKSLSSLVPKLNNDLNNPRLENLEFPDDQFQNDLDEIKTFIAPIPQSSQLQKSRSVASSPQKNVFRTSPLSTRNSSKDTSPIKAFFSLDDHGMENYVGNNPSTPTLTSNAASELYSYSNLKECTPSTTIRGVYVHDWTNNMSPRSLSESLKVGKVTLGQPSISSHQVPGNGSPPFVNGKLKSVNQKNSKPNLKLNTAKLSEPSNPLPSPYTPDQNTNSNINTNSEKQNLPILENLPIIKVSTTIEIESQSGSESSSIASRKSQDSQFSFLRNRTSSIRFYKSNEQVELEQAIDDERLNRLKFKEFLGTSEELEDELQGLCIGSKRIANGFDEDMNYINYEEDDDTDALFNRDLFGLDYEKPKPKDLQLELEDDNNSSLAHNKMEIIDNYEEDKEQHKGENKVDKTERKQEDFGAASKAILQMLNNSNSGHVFKTSNSDILLEHRPYTKLERYRSLKFHQLSCDIEDENDSVISSSYNVELFADKCKPISNYNDDRSDSIWEDSDALEEVNLVPEDYEFNQDRLYENISGNCTYNYNNGIYGMNNMSKGRYSTMMVSNIDDLDSISTNNSTDIEPHLWKNLLKGVSGNSEDRGSDNINVRNARQIKHDDRTITLFNQTCSHSEGNENEHECDEDRNHDVDNETASSFNLHLDTIQE